MKVPNTKVIVFNAAAGLVVAGALIALVQSVFLKSGTLPCSERYGSGTIFSLERGGVMLTATDLQARLGGKDVGVDENVQIVRPKDGPVAVAMRINLPKGSASPLGAAAPKGGISFPWLPRSVRGKSAACLSYSVLLPTDFAFGPGGVLPGVLGTQSVDEAGDSFTAVMAWRERGVGGVTNLVTSKGETRGFAVEGEGFSLPPGRWVKLEQEVVLNSPRQADGALRIWADGKLVVERTDMFYRSKPEVTIAGVAADVFYGGQDASRVAPKDTSIMLSPLEVRWQ